MKTRLTLKMLAAVLPLATFLIIACQKENVSDDAPAPLKIYLTDHQTPIFDSVFIDMQKLEVKLEDDSLSNGGWVNMNIRSGVYNILRFRNGLDTLFASAVLPNNRIRKVRLTVGTQNSVMRNGQSSPLKIKDKEREVVISLSRTNFDINNGQVMLWLDFDAGNSIVVDNSGWGNNNGFELKPRIKAFGKSNTGRIEGHVLPLAANAIVKAVLGSDTATAIPESRSGEFKIIGLNAGNYQLVIDAQNGYFDSTISSVRVINGEDTKLPVINLRR